MRGRRPAAADVEGPLAFGPSACLCESVSQRALRAVPPLSLQTAAAAQRPPPLSGGKKVLAMKTGRDNADGLNDKEYCAFKDVDFQTNFNHHFLLKISRKFVSFALIRNIDFNLFA